MAGSVIGSGSSSLLTFPTRSRLRKVSRPVLASSASSVIMLCWFADPFRTTVASGGVISAGGPAMRIEGESVSSGVVAVERQRPR